MIVRIWDSRTGTELRAEVGSNPWPLKFSTNGIYYVGYLRGYANSKPTFRVKLTNTSVVQGQSFALTLLATDSDNDSLRYSLVNPPAGASVNQTGLFTWTPATSQLGDYVVTAVVSDGSLTDTTRAVITVKMLNVRPTFGRSTFFTTSTASSTR